LSPLFHGLHVRNPLVPQPMAPSTSASRVVSTFAAGGPGASSGAALWVRVGDGGCGRTNVTGAAAALRARETRAEAGRAPVGLASALVLLGEALG
jgi:hypothetical protein